jgi:hypothetical protein
MPINEDVRKLADTYRLIKTGIENKVKLESDKGIKLPKTETGKEKGA